MFLDTLRLNNFRSFEDEQICFRKDLTILVHRKRYHWYPAFAQDPNKGFEIGGRVTFVLDPLPRYRQHTFLRVLKSRNSFPSDAFRTSLIVDRLECAIAT